MIAPEPNDGKGLRAASISAAIITDSFSKIILLPNFGQVTAVLAVRIATVASGPVS